MGGNNHESELRESWKNLLVAQHHDIQICGILDDSRRFLPASIHKSDCVIKSSMDFVSSRMSGGNLGQITVFNPLSWTRKDWINVTISLPLNIKYFDIENGEESVQSSGRWDLDSVNINQNQLVLHEEGTIGSIPYKTELKLYSYSPGIDFKVKFIFNEEKIGRLSDNKREIASSFLHEEKLRFKLFPVLGIGTAGIRDLPFTIAETEDKYVEGNYWTALADGHSGVAFFNRGNMGSVHESDGGFSIPLAYSMYYVWKTVILKGTFNYEFSVYPFEGKWNKADLHRKALEYNFPYLVITSKAGSGKSGNQLQLIRISESGVILSALYTNGGKSLLRFYESKGESGELTLQSRIGPNEYTEVDLRGIEKNKTGPVIQFSPWQMKTIRIENINP